MLLESMEVSKNEKEPWLIGMALSGKLSCYSADLESREAGFCSTGMALELCFSAKYQEELEQFDRNDKLSRQGSRGSHLNNSTSCTFPCKTFSWNPEQGVPVGRKYTGTHSHVPSEGAQTKKRVFKAPAFSVSCLVSIFTCCSSLGIFPWSLSLRFTRHLALGNAIIPA